MTRRSGFTLIEALMAVFVMAIGLLALLTLFPLGAMQMDKAIKDQRSAEAANNAISICKALDMANDTSVNQPAVGITAQPRFRSRLPGRTGRRFATAPAIRFTSISGEFRRGCRLLAA